MAQNKKRILVTGSTGGIGTALSTYLAEKDYELILTARNEENLKKLAGEIKKVTGTLPQIVASDFGNVASLKALASSLNAGIDGLVLMPPQIEPTAECLPPDQAWEQMFKQSFIGPVGLIRELIPALKKRSRSKVAIVSGISSAQVLGHYATSNVLRLAWLAQAKTLALVYGSSGIHFNTLSLGGVMTDEYRAELQSDSKSSGKSFDELMDAQVSNVPLKKYATPREVAVALEGLLSEFSDHMTGLNILCDGGFTRAY